MAVFKQHITIKQLDELSRKGREKLKKRFLENADEPEKEMLKEGWPLLFSIGRIIEFLGDELLEIKRYDDGVYRVTIIYHGKEFFHRDLINALWQAIKELYNA